MHDKHIWHKYYAEAFGTALLVIFGAGSVIINFLTDGRVGVLGIALSHALIIGIVVYVFGGISGAHINPAVTIAFLYDKRIDVKTAIYYVIAQLIGASVGAYFLKIVFKNVVSATALGAPQIKGITNEAGFMLEFAITFMLIFVIMYLVKHKMDTQKVAPLAIGAVILADILLAGYSTGAAINPARAFGPALVANFWVNQTIYFAAPILGGIAAVYASRFWWGEEAK